MYTKDIYKDEIKKFISIKGYNSVSVGKKTYEIYLDHIRDIDCRLRDKLFDIATMENGSEFTMTEKEFNDFLDSI